MKSTFLAFVFSLLLPALPEALGEDDFRGKVKDAGKKRIKKERLIVPGKSYLGLQHGMTENEVIGRLGKPDGYLRLQGTETVMIYGRQKGYLFEDGRLSGVRTSFGLVDHRLADLMTENRGVPDLDWRLDNGVAYEMGKDKVKEILGDRLVDRDYNAYYIEGDYRVTLEFSHYTNEGSKESAYKVISVLVRKD